ncbi:AAA-ATPase [Rhodobacter phage RcCWillis]|nr:AAA-ATPase [Rhodobacter phage RcCWillis]
MTMQPVIHLGQGVCLSPRYLTRHMGIFGATGTGKTTTAATVVKQLRCPVIVLDAKGDLAPLGKVVPPWQSAQMSVGALGADLMRRVLDLSEAQSGALEIALAWAEDHGRACHTMDDLSDILSDIATRVDVSDYGLVSRLSLAAVQRAILRFKRAAPWAFGPTIFNPLAVAQTTVVHAPDLVAVPGLYAAFAAHNLEAIYRGLGELGDTSAPGLAVMVDEAHLLFQDAPRAVVSRLEQIVRLIRSKGVALIFVTQSPADLPPAILGQLATRIQHGLRAGTAAQQTAARAAAETMPGNVAAADILGLGMGEAFISTPNGSGNPIPAMRIKVSGIKMDGRIFSDAPPSISPTPRRSAQVPPDLAPQEPSAAKRRPWYFWPGVIAAGIYGPIILANLF